MNHDFDGEPRGVEFLDVLARALERHLDLAGLLIAQSYARGLNHDLDWDGVSVGETDRHAHKREKDSGDDEREHFEVAVRT